MVNTRNLRKNKVKVHNSIAVVHYSILFNSLELSFKPKSRHLKDTLTFSGHVQAPAGLPSSKEWIYQYTKGGPLNF